jgi:hypothetical protein
MALENVLENQYVSTSLAVFLVLYGGLAAPKLPKSMLNLFSNPIFRMLVIFLIAYTSSKNHSIALVATIVLILIMQESNDEKQVEVAVTNSVVNVDSTSKAVVTKKKFNMDEEESKGESEVIHILKDKSTITEAQLVSTIINDEITKLQVNNNVSQNTNTNNNVAEVISETESVVPEVEKVIESPTRPVAESVPEPIDNTKDIHATEIVDYPLSQNLENGFNTVPVRSTRGLEGSKSCGGNKSESSCDKCSACDSFKKDNYKIDTDDVILGFDGNGFFNVGNL